MCPLPPGDAFLTFCDRRCVDAWADEDPDDELVLQALGVEDDQGPPWCLHCHHCSARVWSSTNCPLCPTCQHGRWAITWAAERFAAELGRHDLTVMPPSAWLRGEQMCLAGLNPHVVAHVVLGRYTP